LGEDVAVTVQARPHHVVPVALSSLAEVAGAAAPSPDVEVTGLSLRSGSVRPGDLYAAVAGAKTHGARFVDQAKSAGARAILTDQDGRGSALDSGLPTLVVERPRAVLGKVADHTGIAFVYQVCAFLPAIGLLAIFLPKMPKTAH